jgi:hypothetical protein
MAGCYMTLGQALVLGGLNFYLIRVLILFGMTRVIVRRELFSIKPNGIDKVWIAWLLVSSLLYVLVDGTHVPTSERLGYVYDAVGIYSLLRALIRDFDDVILTMKLFAVIIIPLAVFFSMEAATGRNPFAALGGVELFSAIRNGKVRAQGPFKHAILAGTFGATALPLFVGLWVHSKRSRALATAAIVAATVIVMTSASSGAFTAFFLSLGGLACWPLKSRMRSIRWGMVAAILALAAVMKAPVWYLMDRVSEWVGGDGWYRSALMDAAIRHFGEWWLVGTGDTAHWMPTGLAGNVNAYSADIVNEFVNQGIRGGLVALLLFIWLLVKCFKTAGAAIRSDNQTRANQFMIWSMGCAFLAHVTSFFSVTYFDQITIFWYLTIAMIAALMHDRSKMLVLASVKAPGPVNVARNPRFSRFPSPSPSELHIRRS